MRSELKRHVRMATVIGLGIGALLAASFAAFAQDEDDFDHHFRLTSATFRNDAFLPLSAIFNNIVSGKNTCTANGAPGGNQSPELSWHGAPAETRSFVVTTYDVTVAFTHWGMYNISGSATGLPENAGVAGSPYGTQIINDFLIGAQYDSPCPPANVPPDVHHYVFTVYALDIDLELPSSTNFPANAETLYQALIEAGKHRHILASASLTGLFSSTSPSH